MTTSSPVDELPFALAGLDDNDNSIDISVALPNGRSPIAGLPAELLLEIFELTLPKHDFHMLLPTYRPFDAYFRRSESESLPRAPWSLTHVCSFWHAVGTSNPTLWSTIAFVPMAGDSWAIELLMQQLVYARDVPLDLWIINPLERDMSEVAAIRFSSYLPVWEALVQRSTQWRSLHIVGPRDHRGLSFLHELVPIQPLPNLEEIVTIGPAASVVHILALAPNLKRAIKGYDEDGFDVHACLPFNRLTAFTAVYRNDIFLYLHLSSAPQLVDCHLSVLAVSSLTSDLSVLHLPLLRRLAIDGICEILGLISAPALENLQMRGDDAGIILPFLKASRIGDTLTRLTLMFFPVPINEVIELLRYTTHITFLAFDYCPDPPLHLDATRVLIQSLTLGVQSLSLCPRLQTLHLTDRGDVMDHAAFNEMYSMLRSRSRLEQSSGGATAALIFCATPFLLRSHEDV
ncbi:hypothetical protein C8F01DRAFT_758660 [Mycena amicta]|nr:hypothetical protein C8F01DRAFT_758660 [Mycena amicta]